MQQTPHDVCQGRFAVDRPTDVCCLTALHSLLMLRIRTVQACRVARSFSQEIVLEVRKVTHTAADLVSTPKSQTPMYTRAFRHHACQFSRVFSNLAERAVQCTTEPEFMCSVDVISQNNNNPHQCLQFQKLRFFVNFSFFNSKFKTMHSP